MRTHTVVDYVLLMTKYLFQASPVLNSHLLSLCAADNYLMYHTLESPSSRCAGSKGRVAKIDQGVSHLEGLEAQ